jgi:hypothetical protein
MQVVNVKLDRRTIGWLAHPCIEVFAFAGFEEEDIVAIVEFGDFVELEQLTFGVKLRLFTTVGKEGIEVIQEMSMSLDILSAHYKGNALLKRPYRKVTPLEVNISTRCRFSFLATPFAVGSFFLVFDLDKAL